MQYSSSTILMCPPDYYGIEYEINPWMSRQRQSDRQVALQQWSALKQMLEEAGARIELLPPAPSLPDLVFTANAALLYKGIAIMARFRYPQRQAEVPHDEKWLAAAGFEIHQVPGDLHFEGAGDALFCGDTLFAGYRIRSHARHKPIPTRALACSAQRDSGSADVPRAYAVDYGNTNNCAPDC